VWALLPLPLLAKTSEQLEKGGNNLRQYSPCCGKTRICGFRWGYIEVLLYLVQNHMQN